MSIKDDLLKLKDKITKSSNDNLESNLNKEVIDLDDKVDLFIKWYYDSMIKGKYTEIGEIRFPKKMRNLIEKIAVWCELRYPDYEVNRLMYCSGQEDINVSDIMFRKNSYINYLLDENDDFKELNWDEFYNKESFIKALPWKEKIYFCKPKFSSIVYLDSRIRGAHLHLANDGTVEMSEDVTIFTNGVIKDEELEGLNVVDVVDLFKERNIKLPEKNELEVAINNYNNWLYQNMELLNCAMYRIIERGGNRIGPRRAFMFAKDFGCNIDIPMKYAVDYSDPGLRQFMNEYIKAGGSKDLECYVGYFSRTDKKEKLNTVTIKDLYLTLWNNATQFYTDEEKTLHQRLVNILASQVDKDNVNKEKVKQLRLERKLERTSKNKK